MQMNKHMWGLVVIAGLAVPVTGAAQQNARLLERQTTATPSIRMTIEEPAVTYPIGATASEEVAAAQTSVQPEPMRVEEPDEPTLKGVSTWWDVTPVGESTRSLMAAQAAGAQAAPALPTLGATASASWDRYLESFSQPLPEWFQQHVEATSSR